MAGSNQHGAFALLPEADVLHVQTTGVWNEVAARRFWRESAAYWEGRAGRPWCVVNDMRQFQGVTPDAAELWLAGFTQATRHGLVAYAYVVSERFYALMLRGWDGRAKALAPIQDFADLAAAEAWARDHLAQALSRGLEPQPPLPPLQRLQDHPGSSS